MTWPFYIERFTRGGDFVASEEFLVRGVPEARIHDPVVDRIAIGLVRGLRRLVGPVCDRGSD